MVVFLVISALVTGVLGANGQEPVLYDPVSVLHELPLRAARDGALLPRERNVGSLVLNAIGRLVVASTLAVNLARGHPIISVAAALVIGWALHRLWSLAGLARVLIEAERAE